MRHGEMRESSQEGNVPQEAAARLGSILQRRSISLSSLTVMAFGYRTDRLQERDRQLSQFTSIAVMLESLCPANSILHQMGSGHEILQCCSTEPASRSHFPG